MSEKRASRLGAVSGCLLMLLLTAGLVLVLAWGLGGGASSPWH